MTNFHDYLLEVGFTVGRVFNQKDQQFCLEYTRAFFDADIVVAPWQSAPPVVKEHSEGEYRWLTPEEQVDDLSDLEELRTRQASVYSVHIQDKNGRVHLTTFDSIIELELLFKLCRVDLP